MTKIVINGCYGGFSLSEEAYKYLGREWDGYGYAEYERDDPSLVSCVETLGKEASGRYSSLRVVEIPDGIRWGIEEDDGMEWVEEVHQTWS